jgi:hypothetical protein
MGTHIHNLHIMHSLHATNVNYLNIGSLLRLYLALCGLGSSVGMATDYELDGPGIESQWGARFFAHIQTGPGAHSAFCTVGTGSFPGAKRPGRGADHPPLLVPRLRMGRAIPLPPLQGHEACNRVIKIFLFTFTVLEPLRNSPSHDDLKSVRMLTANIVPYITLRYVCNTACQTAPTAII